MRLIHTEPLIKVINRFNQIDEDNYKFGNTHYYLIKSSGDAVTTHALSGELYASSSGWLMLAVPNGLVRGAFDALHELGAELPLKDGKLNAHISVMRPEELESIGGIDKINERGHRFSYSLGPIKEVVPDNWEEMSKVWFIEVNSPDLSKLRRSYGLTSLPNDNKYKFHVTFGCRRKNILKENNVSKAAEAPARTAMIFRNKPKFNSFPTERDAFYSAIMEHLKTRGFNPSLAEDNTEPAGDLLIGHGSGNIHLKNPNKSLVFDTSPHEHEKSRVYSAEQKELAKTLGFNSHHELPQAFRKEPPVEHYQFTDEMRSALDNLILDKSKQELAANNAIAKHLSKSLENGSNHNWIGPATLGVGLTGLGGAALMSLKEGAENENAKQNNESADSKEPDSAEETKLRMSEVEEVPGEDEFDCSDEALNGIYNYYGTEKRSGAIDTVKEKIHNIYGKLETRYGPTMAKTIIGAGLVGAPIPGPGTSFLTASPFLAAGEVMHAINGNYVSPRTVKEKEDAARRNHIKKLIAAATVPTAGAGLAAYALHKPTQSDVPAQVTKFPGSDIPEVIRGRVAADAPASTIERTGNAYVIAGGNEHNRTHGTVNDIPQLGELLKNKIKPDQKLGLLELAGHGAYTHQDVGNAVGSEGKISPKTVDQAAAVLNAVPKAEDATMVMGGCHTGLCEPVNPKNDWMKHLADKSDMNILGARAYHNYNADALDTDVHTTARGRVLPQNVFKGNDNTFTPEDYAWSKYSPGKPVEKIIDENKFRDSKHTFSAMPSSKLFESLYNIGKPSAIAGALAAPLIPNKTIAGATALGTTALAAPRAISEILTRYGEATGKNELGQGTGLGTHLETQSKALPYVAMAGLPLASFGIANLLGRWKPREKKRQFAKEI